MHHEGDFALDLVTEIDDGKSTVKKATSSKTSSSSPPAIADYKEYVLAVDVRQYHACFTQLSDIRNNYVRAHLLFEKNAKRLSDPRGEGEGGGNVMTMF